MLDNTRRQILAELKAARGIVDSAKAAQRSMTSGEHDKVENHLGIAEDLKKRDGAADLFNQQLKHISDTCGFGTSDDDSDGAGSGRYTPAGTKTRDGGRTWAKAVVDANGGPKLKALLPAGAVSVAVPAPIVVPAGQPVPTLRTLIPAEATNGAYSFFRQTLRTSNAAAVAHGALKPTSIYELALIEGKATTIAHLAGPFARQDFADADALGGFVQSELFYGLERALEAEIIGGSGAGAHLLGIANTPGIQSQAYATSLITTTRKAVTKLEVLGYAGSGWVMNALDWEQIELSATETGSLMVTEAGQRAPVESSARRLWGSPVVTSPSCPAGVAYYADWNATKLWIREEAEISWSENGYSPNALGAGLGAGDFELNQVRWRAEGRYGFGALRPDAIVQVDLTA